MQQNWKYIGGLVFAGFVGMRSGLFGHKEVDGDVIIYGIFKDDVLKRRLSIYVDDQKVKKWCWDHERERTFRPPVLKGLSVSDRFRLPQPFPDNPPP